jgi:uncharacterized protein (TIGR01777 family)
MGITMTSVVPAAVDELFAWYSRPGSFHRLLPPWLPIRMVSEPSFPEDRRVRLRLPGGVRWETELEEWTPPNRFVERLVSLPVPWHHTHEFRAESQNTTLVVDTVRTPLPSSVLRQPFRFRHRQLADDLKTQAVMRALMPKPATVAITGSSGLVGSALCSLLSTAGNRVIHLVRRAPRNTSERRWDPAAPEQDLLSGVDAVVHLAGASVGGRFTPGHKRAIRESRIGPTENLARLMRSMAQPPHVFVVASAIGYYGADAGDHWLDETSPPGSDFLAQVVVDWEAASAQAEEGGIRVVRVRTGIVQSTRGGVLRLLRPLVATGVAGKLGSGNQWMSWIDLDDLTDIYFRALGDPRVSGPVNAVAPDPVTNEQYVHTLASIMRRPAKLTVPTLGPRLLLGSEGANQLAFASQRVRPATLGALQHQFRRPDLERSLRHQLGRLADGAEH